MNILELLQKWDTELFIKINVDWVNSFGNFFFPVLRKPSTLIPLYIALIIWGFSKFQPKKMLLWLLFIVCIIIFSDQLSSHLLKNVFGRVRPCHEPSLANIINFKVGYRPISGSFPSSHAVNNFAIEGFFFFTLKKYLNNLRWAFLLVAALISYGQIYVGVHYPFDVVGGTILGLLIAYFAAKLFDKKVGWSLKSSIS